MGRALTLDSVQPQTHHMDGQNRAEQSRTEQNRSEHLCDYRSFVIISEGAAALMLIC
jgi:hypothetical protein